MDEVKSFRSGKRCGEVHPILPFQKSQTGFLRGVRLFVTRIPRIGRVVFISEVCQDMTCLMAQNVGGTGSSRADRRSPKTIGSARDEIVHQKDRENAIGCEGL